MLQIIRSHRRPTVLLSILMLALLASSCGKKEAAQETPPADATSTTPAPLTDANIAAIVVAANTIDIKNGENAMAKSQNAAVKAFATQMITDHTSVNKQATDLVTKLGVTPEDNETSRGLVTSADATRESVNTKSGAEFDKAYIDNEVAYHEAVLGVLDQTLIPGASNAELKALLEAVKPAFVAHLEHARQVQTALAK